MPPLLAQNFTDDFFEVNTTVPSYTRWYESAHNGATYRRHRDLLQLVGSTSPEKRWILKYPVHMKHLAAVRLEVYPDACIVQTHRDPTPAQRGRPSQAMLALAQRRAN